MRILMLTQFYHPIIGGEERMVQDLSLELARRRHDVAVATLWHDGQADQENDQGIQIWRMRGTTQRATWLYRETQRRHAPPWPDPEVTWSLRRIIDQVQPDVIHAHNWLMYSYLPLRSSRPAGLVLTLHDYSWACATRRFMHKGEPCSGPELVKCLGCASQHYGPLKGAPTTLGLRFMSAIGRTAIDMFLPVSKAVAAGNGLIDSGLPYQVIPNFVPDETAAKPDDVETQMAQLPAGDFLLFVGDLAGDKGIHVLLKAYAQLESAPPLVLVGRRCVDTPIAFPPNVMFLNAWPHEAVLEAWRRCSLAIIPSVWPEPFGLVALEALTAGRPVIASNIGGLADMVIDGETGQLVPPGDSTALAGALRQIVADRDLRERMGQAARQHAETYRAAAVVPRIEQVYRSIVTEAAATELQRATLS
jgi:glycosyltransferase involved in cell wall biosynthesis